MSRIESIRANYHQVVSTVPPNRTLVVVSKNFPNEDITIVYEEGQRIFGESYAQELVQKAALLPKDIQWHFIGGLQANKIPILLKCPSLTTIQTVDSIAKAEIIEKLCVKIGRQVDVFLQVNASNEEKKHGLHPNLVEPAALHILSNMKRCLLKGLMVIGSKMELLKEGKNPEFELMNGLREDIERSSGVHLLLSMGMSHDYLQAISQDSDVVRVGTSIFGSRSA
jgi:PLP dependent protein